MLDILHLANYKYVLYQDDSSKTFLNLTRESGFGVYDFCFQVELTDMTDINLTISEIENLRKEYLKDPKTFSSKYSEVKLDPEKTKNALRDWMTKK